MQKNEIDAILFTLKVNNDQLLFLMLDSKGSITRMGIGNYSNDPMDQEMFIGHTREKIFKKLISMISKGFLEHVGRVYKVDEPKGKTCDLQILLKSKDSQETGIGFVYGTESNGPPPDVGNLVSTAVKLTNSWYEQYKEKVRMSRK